MVCTVDQTAKQVYEDCKLVVVTDTEACADVDVACCKGCSALGHETDFLHISQPLESMVCHMTFLSPWTQTSHIHHQLTLSCIIHFTSSFIIPAILFSSFLAHQSLSLIFNPKPVQQGSKIIHEPFKCAVNTFIHFQPHYSPQSFKSSNHLPSDPLQHLSH